MSQRRIVEVEAAREGERVVDDDDLLVVGGAERVRVVELEREAGVCVPGEAVGRQRLAFQREQDGEIPGEREHAQLGPAGEDVVQERAARSAAARRFPGCSSHAAVDVPAEDEHDAARAADRVPESREVGVGVNQEGGAPGRRDPPAVFPFSRGKFTPGK